MRVSVCATTYIVHHFWRAFFNGNITAMSDWYSGHVFKMRRSPCHQVFFSLLCIFLDTWCHNRELRLGYDVMNCHRETKFTLWFYAYVLCTMCVCTHTYIQTHTNTVKQKNFLKDHQSLSSSPPWPSHYPLLGNPVRLKRVEFSNSGTRLDFPWPKIDKFPSPGSSHSLSFS